MSKNLIQIRGSNCVGKSTCVREFSKINGITKEILIEVNKNRKVSCLTNEKIVIIGKYNNACGGCDAYIKNKKELLEVIEILMKSGFEVIIFEGVIYGKTVKLATEFFHVSKKYGYKYIPITLFCDYEKVIERLLNRNGGNLKNEDNLFKGFNASIIADKTLNKQYFKTYSVNTSCIPENEMYLIIERVLNEQN